MKQTLQILFHAYHRKSNESDSVNPTQTGLFARYITGGGGPVGPPLRQIFDFYLYVFKLGTKLKSFPELMVKKKSR